MRILILEDDESIAERIGGALAGALGADIHVVARGEDALEAASRPGFDVLVLDRMVVGMEGLSVLAELRRREVQTPALILSSKRSAMQKVEGLDNGADDYLGKPFQDFELVARVRALHRRAEKMEHPDVRVHGPLLMAVRNRRALWQPGVPGTAVGYSKRYIADQQFDLQLTDKEFDILLCLIEAYPDPATKDRIWDFAWRSYQLADWRQVVNVNMSRLRKKLDDRTGRRLILQLAHVIQDAFEVETLPTLEMIAQHIRQGLIRAIGPSGAGRQLEVTLKEDQMVIDVGRYQLDQSQVSGVTDAAVPTIIQTVGAEGYVITDPASLAQLAECGAIL